MNGERAIIERALLVAQVGTYDLKLEDMEGEVAIARAGALQAGIQLSDLEAGVLWSAFSADEYCAGWMSAGSASANWYAGEVANYCRALIERTRAAQERP